MMIQDMKKKVSYVVLGALLVTSVPAMAQLSQMLSSSELGVSGNANVVAPSPAASGSSSQTAAGATSATSSSSATSSTSATSSQSSAGTTDSGTRVINQGFGSSLVRESMQKDTADMTQAELDFRAAIQGTPTSDMNQLINDLKAAADDAKTTTSGGVQAISGTVDPNNLNEKQKQIIEAAKANASVQVQTQTTTNASSGSVSPTAGATAGSATANSATANSAPANSAPAFGPTVEAANALKQGQTADNPFSVFDSQNTAMNTGNQNTVADKFLDSYTNGFDPNATIKQEAEQVMNNVQNTVAENEKNLAEATAKYEDAKAKHEEASQRRQEAEKKYQTAIEEANEARLEREAIEEQLKNSSLSATEREQLEKQLADAKEKEAQKKAEKDSANQEASAAKKEMFAAKNEEVKATKAKSDAELKSMGYETDGNGNLLNTAANYELYKETVPGATPEDFAQSVEKMNGWGFYGDETPAQALKDSLAVQNALNMVSEEDRGLIENALHRAGEYGYSDNMVLEDNQKAVLDRVASWQEQNAQLIAAGKDPISFRDYVNRGGLNRTVTIYRSKTFWHDLVDNGYGERVSDSFGDTGIIRKRK